MPRDLFGEERPNGQATEGIPGKRKPTKRNGYAALPGTGPAGETCQSCVHLFHNRMAKTYLKCGLMRARWTGGPGTDVLAKAPACRRWESPVQRPE